LGRTFSGRPPPGDRGQRPQQQYLDAGRFLNRAVIQSRNRSDSTTITSTPNSISHHHCNLLAPPHPAAREARTINTGGQPCPLPQLNSRPTRSIPPGPAVRPRPCEQSEFDDLLANYQADVKLQGAIHQTLFNQLVAAAWKPSSAPAALTRISWPARPSRPPAAQAKLQNEPNPGDSGEAER
jgi:hypothetical protein